LNQEILLTKQFSGKQGVAKTTEQLKKTKKGMLQKQPKNYKKFLNVAFQDLFKHACMNQHVC